MINSGAYIAEVLAAQYYPFTKGFREAGSGAGRSRREAIRHVILPLALRRMLPPLGNQWIVASKDTSLFIVIGVAEELIHAGRKLLPVTFRHWKSGAPWPSSVDHYAGVELLFCVVLKKDENPCD